VVDLGTGVDENGRVTGDACFDELIKKADVTPDRGGTGPMTIAHLMGNLVKACELYSDNT
ncbi:MAG: bifunctional methylenetetrahydrofolate dehydrogenase/methenyltetrahydrofolate cyclohydrolase, partial [Deltaproteobacteria bacterium]